MQSTEKNTVGSSYYLSTFKDMSFTVCDQLFVYMRICVPFLCLVQEEGQKMASSSLKIRVTGDYSATIWELGIEPRFSGRAAIAFNQ